jgi:hypothetical protein
MRAVEDAIARQVFHGGDLPTNLLEQGAVREELLTPILAESFGMDPGPIGKLSPPSAAAMRVLPGDLALRHVVFPLELEGRSLLVATAEPLAPAVEDDLGFALALSIRQVIVPAVRVRQAIAEHYNIPLERRWLRLVARLDGSVDPSPSAVPPPGADLSAVRMPRPVSIPSPSFGTGVLESEPAPARLDTRPPLKTPFVAGHDLAIPAIPKSPGLPRDAIDGGPAYDDKGGYERPAPPPADDRPPSAPPAPQPPGVATIGSVGAQPLHEKPLPERTGGSGTRALAGLVRQALRDERASAPVDKTADRAKGAWRPAPRRRGPFTTAMAERELEDATASDAVLDIVFAFAHQFFEYAALFVIHGDLAEGRDANGPGADRARIAGVGVPLDLPSSFARAKDRRALVIAPLEGEGLDADLARDLGRVLARPRAVAFLPLLVKNRVVAMIYGDDGEDDVQLARLGEVLSVMGLATAALERIALRKKLGAKALDVPVRVKIQDAGAAALARAITVSAMAAVAPPPERAAPPAPPAPPAGPPSVPPPSDTEVSVVRPGLRVDTPFPDAAPIPRPDVATVPVFPAVEHHSSPTIPEGFAAVARFAVAPPDEESPLAGVTPVPRTVRTPVATSAEGDAPLRRTSPGLGVQLFEGAPRGEPVVEGERAARPGHPGPTRRGTAPVFEGRSGRAQPPLNLEPLPSTPPANATAWTSFPSNPPPTPSLNAVSLSRPRSDRPIPREEVDSSRTPLAAPTVEDTGVVPRAAARSPEPPAVEPGNELQALVNRVIEGGRAGQEAFDELVRSGDPAVQAVMSRFPGPLRVDRHRARAELPAASQCGPILELCVALRRPALPYVSPRLISPDPEIRFWATHVLGELRYPEAANALLPRLFDDDASVRRIARRSAAALVNAGPPGAPILRGLDDITRNRDQPAPHRALAIETMGEIRAGSMVPPLLAALDDPTPDVAESARRALMLITRQDFGLDTASWRAWWDDNGTRHRVEWLIDALMHEQPSLRRAAGDELKQLTKEYFGYYDDLPKRERERAQAAYRSWWEREGRARFV